MTISPHSTPSHCTLLHPTPSHPTPSHPIPSGTGDTTGPAQHPAQASAMFSSQYWVFFPSLAFPFFFVLFSRLLTPPSALPQLLSISLNTL